MDGEKAFRRRIGQIVTKADTDRSRAHRAFEALSRGGVVAARL
jgi:hypothetical protein